MKVKDIKEILDKYPDDMEVFYLNVEEDSLFPLPVINIFKGFKREYIEKIRKHIITNNECLYFYDIPDNEIDFF